ncbi:hypothetical protein GX563_01345 [Candidatus Bathyarchaeota archaeon]|nr:hypothetical protein [Candidatus Bathyarchaeota archaeon]
MISKEAMVYKPYRNPKAILYGIIFIVAVAIPISILIYLFLEGSLIFTVTLSAIMLAVLFLFAYLTFFGKNLNYELSTQEIKINFGLLKKKIACNMIANAEIVDLKIILRILAHSVPGFQWGSFKTSIGNINVYATKLSGEFVVITLNDGEKIALSPAEPQPFLWALKEKALVAN